MPISTWKKPALPQKSMDVCNRCRSNARRPEIQIIVNITNPDSHFDISMRVIEANKAIYSEKPLATSLGSVRFLLDLAEKKGVLVGSAQDNFLGLITNGKKIDQ